MTIIIITIIITIRMIFPLSQRAVGISHNLSVSLSLISVRAPSLTFKWLIEEKSSDSELV